MGCFALPEKQTGLSLCTILSNIRLEHTEKSW